ncbi:MAG TPA: hypothetical protein VFF63_08795 [Candidatus Babeliales bacterium]|nr:hypothetical protein [Candidatus Babeliales bacterium]
MRLLCCALTAAILAACGGGTSVPPLGSSLAPSAKSHPFGDVRHAVGLGKVLTSKSGQIYGFAVDEKGTVGVLATASNIETFDALTGQIKRSFPKQAPSGTSYSLAGIVNGDVALVIRYVVPKGSIYATRYYDLIDPVTAGRFTAKWTPPVTDIQVEDAGPNQTSSTTAIFAIELKNQDIPIIFGSDVPKNEFGKVFPLNPSYFSLGDQPQVAQDTATNQAVLATSPDGGKVGGEAPINVLMNLSTGQQTEFSGLNNGFYGAGFVNGLAVDSTTGIAATTTELNAQVEFYNLAQETGTYAQLPCTNNTSQSNSGTWIAGDPANRLFLVADPDYCNGSQGSAIVVYGESGNFVESLTGFNFDVDQIDAGLAVLVPAMRMGWAPGPNADQLQQFYY